MKKLQKSYFIFAACLFLLGCQTSTNEENNNETKEENGGNEENNVTEKDIFDFKHIDKAPDATEKQPITDVIKVYFEEWTIDTPSGAVAIDIKENEIYVNPIISGRGLRAQDGIVEVSDMKQIHDILEKYDVQEWKADYTFEDPSTYEDGYSWKLWLQFADGSVEKHAGKGTDEKKLTPENFKDFANELKGFVDEGLQQAAE